MASVLISLMLLLLVYHHVDCTRCLVSSTNGRFGEECPLDWITWRSQCYKIISDLLTWREAKEQCIKMDALLVVPLSKDETKFLLTLFRKPKFWINCNDIETEGQWVCQEDGAMVQYREWRQNEPDNFGVENCAVAYYEGWNDLSCTNKCPAICKQKSPMLHF
ncbi:CD209 antigen-like protein C [Asterias amurensis]|uniref:CD209 antigen-like protein C n=1 Tax=Asterias amurensis TaxID=7602 RepID=UPI003AB750BD